MSFSIITAISMFKQQAVVNDPILNKGQKITAVIDFLAIALIATFAALAICHINPIPGFTITHQNASIMLITAGVVLTIDLVTFVIRSVYRKKTDIDIGRTDTESVSSGFFEANNSGRDDPNSYSVSSDNSPQTSRKSNKEKNEAHAHLEPSIPQPSQQKIHSVPTKEHLEFLEAKDSIEEELHNQPLYAYMLTSLGPNKLASLGQSKHILSIKLRNYSRSKLVIRHIVIYRNATFKMAYNEEATFNTPSFPGVSFHIIKEIVDKLIIKEKWNAAISKAKVIGKDFATHPKALKLDPPYWLESLNVPKWERYERNLYFGETQHYYVPYMEYLMKEWDNSGTDLPFELWLPSFDNFYKCKKVSYEPKKMYLNKEMTIPDGNYLYILDTQDNFILIENLHSDVHHHSSIMQGGAVLCAGYINIVKQKVNHFNRHSGHYKPDKEHFEYAVQKLFEKEIPTILSRETLLAEL